MTELGAHPREVEHGWRSRRFENLNQDQADLWYSIHKKTIVLENEKIASYTNVCTGLH